MLKILLETAERSGGDWRGIVQPMVHYIPLKKDFSNFNEVIALFRNPETNNRKGV